jgi:hypothetical protein
VGGGQALAESEAVLPALLKLLDHSSGPARAKGLLALQQVLARHPPAILPALDRRLLPLVERAARDAAKAGDAYLAQCAASALRALAALAPPIAAAAAEELGRMAAARRPAPAAGAAAAATGGAAAGVDGQGLRGRLGQFPVLLHLLASPAARGGAVSSGVLQSLGACLRLAWDLPPFPGQAEFRRLLLLVAEALAQLRALVVAHADAVAAYLLPGLVHVVVREEPPPPLAPPPPAAPGGAGGGGAAVQHRFQCLRALGEMLQALMSEPAVYDPAAHAAGAGGRRAERAAASTRVLHELLVRTLLPRWVLSPAAPQSTLILTFHDSH